MSGAQGLSDAATLPWDGSGLKYYTWYFVCAGSANHGTEVFLYGIQPPRYGILRDEIQPRRDVTVFTPTGCSHDGTSRDFLYGIRPPRDSPGGMQPRRDSAAFFTRAMSWRLVACVLLQQPSRQVWAQEDDQVLKARHPRTLGRQQALLPRRQQALLSRWRQALLPR